MFLLKEQHAGEQSFFAPYLDLLPPPSRFVSVQEPCIFAETPDIFSKEPYISAKEPYVLAQGATSGGVFRPISLSLFVVAACRCVRKRALHFRKRALYFRKRALCVCQKALCDMHAEEPICCRCLAGVCQQKDPKFPQ